MGFTDPVIVDADTQRRIVILLIFAANSKNELENPNTGLGIDMIEYESYVVKLQKC